MRDELLHASADPVEEAEEVTLRPRRLDEFVGQPRLKEHLEILLGAARGRGQAADHILFAGPPGLGKTTLSGIVAEEMGVGLRITSGPALERAGDLAAILTNLDDGDVLFIDEIHRLPRPVEEVLYPAMEDFQLDIVIGKGPAARSIRLDLPRFTLIGATTRTGLITGPLRDRFGFIARLDYYDTDDLVSIIERAAGILGVPLETEGAQEIARRARGTPRIANRLLKRTRDYAEVRADGAVTTENARLALELFEVDELGLDKVDRAILAALCETFGGQPVGLHTLAVAVAEEPETVEEVYEPFLLKAGLLQRTPRGRIATPGAYAHLHLPAPHVLPSLFTSPTNDQAGVTCVATRGRRRRRWSRRISAAMGPVPVPQLGLLRRPSSSGPCSSICHRRPAASTPDAAAADGGGRATSPRSRSSRSSPPPDAHRDGLEHCVRVSRPSGGHGRPLLPGTGRGHDRRDRRARAEFVSRPGVDGPPRPHPGRVEGRGTPSPSSSSTSRWRSPRRGRWCRLPSSSPAMPPSTSFGGTAVISGSFNRKQAEALALLARPANGR